MALTILLFQNTHHSSFITVVELVQELFKAQHVEQEQEVPLRLGMIVSWIRCRLFQQHHWLDEGQATDRHEHRSHRDNVFPDLPRKKEVGLGLQLLCASPERTCRASL